MALHTGDVRLNLSVDQRFHAGEIEVQRRAGVQQQAGRVSEIIRSAIPAVAQLFLREQRMLVVSSLDSRRRSWASLLTGKEGFVRTIDEHVVEIDAEPVEGDPLRENLRAGIEIGLLAIEFYTRRRVKLKGRHEPHSGNMIRMQISRVYALCPNYIQARSLESHPQSIRETPVVVRSNHLSAAQQKWIAGADTFFIATYHPETGADASHRGGMPGFVRMIDSRRLLFPDYRGNKMFNTLGNLTAHSSAGLLFLDFEHAHALQLTGKAEIVWDKDELRDFPGAERLVRFEMDESVQINNVAPFAWRFHNYSPVNPK